MVRVSSPAAVLCASVRLHDVGRRRRGVRAVRRPSRPRPVSIALGRRPGVRASETRETAGRRALRTRWIRIRVPSLGAGPLRRGFVHGLEPPRPARSPSCGSATRCAGLGDQGNRWASRTAYALGTHPDARPRRRPAATWFVHRPRAAPLGHACAARRPGVLLSAARVNRWTSRTSHALGTPLDGPGSGPRRSLVASPVRPRERPVRRRSRGAVRPAARDHSFAGGRTLRGTRHSAARLSPPTHLARVTGTGAPPSVEEGRAPLGLAGTHRSV